MNTSSALAAIRSVGGTDVLQTVLSQAISPRDEVRLEDINDYFSKRSFRVANYGEGALALLNATKVISVLNSRVRVLIDLDHYSRLVADQELLASAVIERLLRLLGAEKAFSEIFPPGAVYFNEQRSEIQLNENAIRYEYRHVKSVLLELGMLARINSYGLLRVNPDYCNLYDELVFPNFASEALKLQLPEDKLEEYLVNRKDRGREAEEFVVNFERTVLSEHPHVHLIRRISDMDVSCGYDIQSFEDIKSARVDKFIEVKSFLGREKFYWTRNEIEVSKIYSDRYFLYLIDFSLIAKPGYRPMIIRNPYEAVFLDGRRRYRRETELFSFEALS